MAANSRTYHHFTLEMAAGTLFGLYQFDPSGNPFAQNLLSQLGFNSTQISQLELSSTSQSTIDSLNSQLSAELSTSNGQSILNNAYSQWENNTLSPSVQNAIDNSSTAISAQILSSPVAVQRLYDIVNQFTPTTQNNGLANFLQGGSYTGGSGQTATWNNSLSPQQNLQNWFAVTSLGASPSGETRTSAFNSSTSTETFQNTVVDISTGSGGSSIELDGLKNTVANVYSGATLTVGGSGSGNTINLSNGAAFTNANTNSETITCGNSTGVLTGQGTETCSIDSSGNGTLNSALSGGTLNLSANANVQNTGSNDSISGSSGDTISSSGGSDTIAGGAGGDLILNGSSAIDNVSLSSGSISVGANTASYISGSASNGSDSISLSSGSNIGLLGGSGYYTVSGSGANVGTAYGAGLLLGGGSDTVSLGQGSSLGLLGGSNYTVSGTSATIGANWNASFYLGGTGNTATLSSGSNIGVLGGNATVNSTSNFVGEANGTAVTLGGGSNVVSFDSSGNTLLASAANDVGVSQGLTNEVVNISNSTVRVGDNASVQINGSNDKILGGASDTFHVSGTYDDVSADASTIDFSGTDTGDIVDGSSDAGYGWGGYDPTGYYGYGGGYGGYGGYGFANKTAATGKNIGVIASFDAAVGDQADADRVVAARLQAVDAVNGTATAGGYSPVLDGAKWRKGTITWTIDGAAGAGGVQFTDQIQSQYEQTIEDAFAVWGKASGLKFQEVSSPNADIHIGWSSFAAASSGVLGYTDIRSQGGIALPGATIALEDPTDLALTAGPGGALTYAGTNATLEQVLLHEVGHALGLAADSDPSSIMNPVLSQQNQTLDSTDLKGIQELYGSSASKKVAGFADAYATQAAQLVSQMAAFGAQSGGGVSTLHIPTSIGAATTLNLAVTH